MWSNRINNSFKEEKIFNNISNDWWNPNGKFKILHKFNKVRIPYIINNINAYFKLNNNFSSLDILDVGCGGGLISEELAKLKANLTAIDSNLEAINTAKTHAEINGLSNINYLTTKLENLNENNKFDVILLMEILEHIPNIEKFLLSMFKLIKPNGIILFSTINRNVKSFLLAKIVAEYIIKWVPKGIHSYNNFIKPFELQKYFMQNNFKISNIKGIRYNFHYNKWELTNKPSVNYIGVASSTNY